MSSKPLDPIHLLWFKRDLRWQDNDALFAAIKNNNYPLLMIYIFEPSLISNEHYSKRHWEFVQESLNDLNAFLTTFNAQVVIIHDETINALIRIQKQFLIKAIFSTEETGIQVTYDRDLAVQSFCKLHNISWHESQNNGVLRGISSRDQWTKKWYEYMSKKIVDIPFDKAQFLDSNKLDFPSYCYPISIEKHPEVQLGGRTQGKRWEDSFFNDRIQYYSKFISKPEGARLGCSRLSPYHAWGCLSIREVYQRNMALKETSKFKKELSAHRSRLRWQSHFIQKFEQEMRMEFEAVNRGYLSLEQPHNDMFVSAWINAQTGYPLVDASLVAVRETGYLNFRMRTMITSFLHHHLFQHFTAGSKWLARQFTDFEPGIHYGQLQMQAGFTGTNTIRIYNPTKNAQEHDSDATFIKKWLPQMKNLPAQFAIEPWLMTALESQLYDFKLGNDYPERVVDTKVTRERALKALYGHRKLQKTRDEKQRILNEHTIKTTRRNA